MDALKLAMFSPVGALMFSGLIALSFRVSFPEASNLSRWAWVTVKLSVAGLLATLAAVLAWMLVSGPGTGNAPPSLDFLLWPSGVRHRNCGSLGAVGARNAN